MFATALIFSQRCINNRLCPSQKANSSLISLLEPARQVDKSRAFRSSYFASVRRSFPWSVLLMNQLFLVC